MSGNGLTYLDLCRWVLPRVGYSGDMATVQGGTREHMLVASAVADADMEIQTMYQDWRFLKAVVDMPMEAGAPLIGKPDEAASYDLGRWWASDQHGRQFKVHPQHGRPDYMDQPLGSPSTAWILPDSNILITPTPDDEYTLTVPYRRIPRPMAQTDDQSAIPAQFRYAIAWLALQQVSQIEEAMAVEQFAHRSFLQWMVWLKSDQLPGHQQLGSGQHLDDEAVRAI